MVGSGLSKATQACFDMSAGLKRPHCCLTLSVAGDGIKLRLKVGNCFCHLYISGVLTMTSLPVHLHFVIDVSGFFSTFYFVKQFDPQ